MNYIDTHAHLSDEAFGNDIDDVLFRAREAGVSHIVMPDVGCEGREALMALCDAHEGYLLPLVGVHPTTINEVSDWRVEVAEVERMLSEGTRRYYGVGEIGLDYYWSRDHVEAQRAAFVAQCELALRYDLPVNIHTRDAWADMCDVLEGFSGRGLRGVMHAFCDTAESYERIVGCGDFYFSIGGVVTFKRSSVADVVREVGVERLLLETDAPYLTPAPYRGRRNESGYLKYICTKIGELTNTPEEEVATITTRNAKQIYNI